MDCYKSYWCFHFINIHVSQLKASSCISVGHFLSIFRDFQLKKSYYWMANIIRYDNPILFIWYVWHKLMVVILKNMQLRWLNMIILQIRKWNCHAQNNKCFPNFCMLMTQQLWIARYTKISVAIFLTKHEQYKKKK